MPTESNRSRAVPASPIRKLVPYADGARRRGLEVLHLNIGQPDVETPAVMRQALETYGEAVIAYGPSGGDAPFREFLTGYYANLGVTLQPHELLVTTGGSEAVLFAFAGCLDHGDDVLIPDPMYANYLGYAAMMGNTVVPIPTQVEDGYHLPGDLSAYLTPKTKAVLLCNPANPTGAVYTADEIVLVVDLCVVHDLFLIADEVYREFVYDGPTAPSVLSHPRLGERAVVVDSLSKRFSLCGARIGCFVTRHDGVASAAMRFAQARLSPPALAQAAATAARHLPNDYFAAVKDEYRRRRDVVYEALQSIDGVVARKPEGAFYQMARLPVDDAEGFVKFMLQEYDVDGTTVMVAPGQGFYAAPNQGRDEVRIAYVLEPARLEQAMSILHSALRAYPGSTLS